MQKKIANLCRLILSDRNTRNLFFFLLLNLFFAFVELTYGLLTNRGDILTAIQSKIQPITSSLGLISDSFHMFFDCSALLLGLAASIVSKWKPSEKFTYGFGRAEILAGLANGLFLLFIALFIMKEAIERSFEPPEVHHERLFVISVLGFLVNLVGIFVFQHGGQGHHHGSGGCSHSNHSHTKLDNHHQHSPTDDHNSHGYSHYSSPTLHDKQRVGVVVDMNGYSTGRTEDTGHFHNEHNHNHTSSMVANDYNHQDQITFSADKNSHMHASSFDSEPLIDLTSNRTKSSGRGQIMQSVFLHIVADTLGSIGVMVSALLMNQFGLMIADPLCSLFIAILISISVYPLLRDSFYVLMQRIPVDLEEKLPNCLQRIQGLNGVLSVHESHFWTLNSDTYIGCLKLEVAQGADHRYILNNSKSLLNHLGVNKIHIQIDQV